MEEAYRSECGLEAFSAAREQFEWLITQMHSAESASLEHGDIEAIIHHDGTELLRRLFQAHLDWRANCERKLKTLFGEVSVRRMGYSARGHGSLFPEDRKLNLPDGLYSQGLSARACREAAGQAFDEVVAAMKREPGGAIPKRQLEATAIAAS